MSNTTRDDPSPHLAPLQRQPGAGRGDTRVATQISCETLDAARAVHRHHADRRETRLPGKPLTGD